jgi:hypothetical protein
MNKNNEWMSNKMLKICLALLFLTLSLTIGSVAGSSTPETTSAKDSKRWTAKFNTAACTWSSTGKNDYFILEPGYQVILEGREGKESVHLEITVLNETMKIGNIETRIVEEKELHDGQLEEISRNFFAICGPTNDVFYFGEDVDEYKNGKVDNHDGSWVAEKGDAKAGLFMPARPLLGARYYQEMAPLVAMDRVEVMNDVEFLNTPAGQFSDCVKTEETTPLEPDAREYKIYAKGIGVIQDGDLILIKYGTISLKNP